MRRIGHCFARVVALAVVLTFASGVSAQRLETLFDDGNTAYYAGDYDAAIRAYEQLNAAGVVDASVSHNLGTAYAKTGRLGPAVLHLERSLYLAPGASDTLHNLEETRRGLAERLTQTRGEVETAESSGLADAIVRGIGATTLAIVLLVFWFLAFMGLLVRGRAKNTRLKLASALVAVLGLIFSALFGALLAAKHGLLDEGEPAIVIGADNPLLEGPDPRSTARGEAYEGERAQITGEDAEFVRVDLGGGRSGWLASESVGRVRPSE